MQVDNSTRNLIRRASPMELPDGELDFDMVARLCEAQDFAKLGAIG
jgi:hypothetical protein